MHISIIDSSNTKAYEAMLNTYIKSIFGKNSKVIFNSEFVCAILIEDQNKIIASGCAYSRLMKQGENDFKAGIIGNVTVSPNYRGLGLTKVVMKELDKYLVSCGITHSFLFAYEPNIYKSSGYTELTLPIHYFDEVQKSWKQFIYRGGMIKSYTDYHVLNKQVIEFNGCVY